MVTKPRSRLYVTDPLTTGSVLRLDDERSHYVARVLRLRVGDAVVLFNGDGGEYVANISAIARSSVEIRTGPHQKRDLESPLQINLAQGISRSERMDTVVQKATELGVHRITPILTARSVVRLNSEKGEKRREHWARVAQSACEQCGRNIVPVIEAPLPFNQWLAGVAETDTTRVLLHPDASGGLAGASEYGTGWQLLVGPEGGLSDTEASHALARGFRACSLGPRVLRTETAAIAAIAILQNLYGDLASSADRRARGLPPKKA